MLTYALITAGLLFTTAAQPASEPPATQTPPRPSADTRTDPVLNSQGLDELTLEMLKRRDPPPPVQPVLPKVRVATPPEVGQAIDPFLGIGAAGLGARQPPSLLPEGAFLIRRRGSIAQSATGDRIFLAHPDAAGSAERAIVLLPSPGLAQIEDDLARTGPRAVCILTGQVFIYRGQNYILPTALNVLSADELAVPPTSPSPREEVGASSIPPESLPPNQQTGGAGAPEQPSTNPPSSSAESLIRDIENRRGQPRSISRPTAPPTGSTPNPSAPDVKPVSSDIALITDRRARVTRLPDGRFAVVFDRGFGSRAESTMPLLECYTLQRLEGYALGRDDSLAFNITGRAIPYRDQHYFLVTGFVFAPPSDVNSLQ